MRASRIRIAAVGSVAAYIAVLLYTYGSMVGPQSYRLGLDSRPIPLPNFLLSLALAIFPSLWMPLGTRRPSLLLFLVQYLIIYIPACFILYQTGLPALDPSEALRVILVMFAGLSVIQAVYWLPTAALPRLRVRQGPLLAALLAAGVVMFLYILFLFGSNFRIADFRDVYQIRLSLATRMDALGNWAGQYAIMWLTGFLLPLALALGFFTAHRWLIPLGAAGYVALYGIGGNKLSLLAVAIIPMLYLWTRFFKRTAVPAFASGLSFLLLVPVALDGIGLSLAKYWYVGVVNQRIFAVPALIAAQFYRFFCLQPLTYFSHIRGLAWLAPYPYEMDLPRTVGHYFYNDLVGANTNFWAGDGLAGFGLPGIILVSFVCAALFWAIDSATSGLKPEFTMVCLGFAAAIFANLSLATVLLSGGLGLLICALYLLPAEGGLSPLARTGRMPAVEGG